MKRAFKYILCTGVAFSFATCAPMEPKKPDLGSLPDIGSINVTTTQDATVPYRINFKIENSGVVGMWDFGSAGGTKVSNNVTVDFPFSGEQTATLKVYNKAGISVESKEVAFTVKQGSATIPGTPGYLLIQGSPWVWDKETQGHWGNASQGKTFPEWDNAAPNSQPAEMYDDVLWFNADGTFTLETNGAVRSNEEPLKKGMFGPEWVNATSSTVIPYVQPSDSNWGWNAAAGTPYASLTFSGGAFPSYVPSDSYLTDKYEIMTLDETVLWMRVMYSDWGGWFYRFIPRDK